MAASLGRGKVPNVFLVKDLAEGGELELSPEVQALDSMLIRSVRYNTYLLFAFCFYLNIRHIFLIISNKTSLFPSSYLLLFFRHLSFH